MPSEILDINDIKNLVDTFYGKIRKDDLLGQIFNDRIQDRWPEHLEKMYRFWQTILLEEHTYNGSPFAPHANLPVGKEHFSKWIEIFHHTIDELFEGKKADEAKWRAGKMAEMFHFKIQYYQNNSASPIS
ncbi:group III truncated hemoglobin [Acidiluteibacter ferrifornacis]|jgi:hemoglobin|uniref:Globin n=1 Tax=Acidiluteibacter ferrifornacis TaxID=2692424 RepID=A0A6N9NKE5_9FLAO|nr:group III truncated hemoglobin [Acidiluteibacter ferrifornacis]NBG65670.1 globin [Acidiluteibacter ferrifornacis]